MDRFYHTLKLFMTLFISHRELFSYYSIKIVPYFIILISLKLSACIGIIRHVLEILLFQPQLFFLILRNVNPLNLENKGACAVITADDHHSAVICPLAHNGAAMQRCINISADGTLFADSFFSYCWLPVA